MGSGGSIELKSRESSEEERASPPSQQSSNSPPPSPRRSIVASIGEAITTLPGKRNSQRKLDEKVCQHLYVESCDVDDFDIQQLDANHEADAKGAGQNSATTGKYHCLDCKQVITDIARIQREDEWKKHILEEDEKIRINKPGDDERVIEALNRGVTISWLLEFTKQHDCWLLPTWLVRRNIILPATAALRCRYVDLPQVRQSGAVGKATTYLSHCWGAPWGALITAITTGTPDLSRRIWCDIFAIRQWHGNKADFNYRHVIPLCPSFILCCSSRPSHRLNSSDPLTGDAKNILSLSRTWCLVELHTAILSNSTIIIRCGAYQRPSFLHSQHLFKLNAGLLERLVVLINLKSSLTSLPSDHSRLLRDMEESPGGIEGVQSLVKGVVKGALLCHILSFDESLYHAACGDTVALDHLLKTCPGQSLVQAAAGGFLALVQLFLEKGVETGTGTGTGTGTRVNIETKYHEYTPLMAASLGGHLETVKYLLSHGASVEAIHHPTGNTSLSFAASNGFHESANLLLLKGAHIDFQNTSHQTSLMLAAENGHTHTVTFLLSRGAQINHHDNKGATSLYLAAANGHASTVKVLLSKGAMKFIKNSEGYTAITIAEKNEFHDCVALLTEQTETRRPR